MTWWRSWFCRMMVLSATHHILAVRVIIGNFTCVACQVICSLYCFNRLPKFHSKEWSIVPHFLTAVHAITMFSVSCDGLAEKSYDYLQCKSSVPFLLLLLFTNARGQTRFRLLYTNPLRDWWSIRQDGYGVMESLTLRTGWVIADIQ